MQLDLDSAMIICLCGLTLALIGALAWVIRQNTTTVTHMSKLTEELLKIEARLASQETLTEKVLGEVAALRIDFDKLKTELEAGTIPPEAQAILTRMDASLDRITVSLNAADAVNPDLPVPEPPNIP